MDWSEIKIYQTMASTQNVIKNAATLDEALREGMRIITDRLEAQAAIL